MPFFNPASIHRNILLDGRLALFHQRQRWLAVADLHFGYELSQRAQGHLFPLWGMQHIEARLDQLLTDYKPEHLVLLGDLVHDGAGAVAFADFVRRIRQRCELILISGNHDRHIKHRTSNGASPARTKHPILDSWRFRDFYFHHGNCVAEVENCIQIIGHHHPAGTVRDGAGLRLKLPAFVQQKNCWIMPAFSPWAAGANWFDTNSGSKIWLCSPERVFEMSK